MRIREKGHTQPRVAHVYREQPALDPDDTLVVWKMDCLGRTTKGLIDLVELLKERGVGFKSLQDNIDTSTPMGQFFVRAILRPR